MSALQTQATGPVEEKVSPEHRENLIKTIVQNGEPRTDEQAIILGYDSMEAFTAAKDAQKEHRIAQQGAFVLLGGIGDKKSVPPNVQIARAIIANLMSNHQPPKVRGQKKDGLSFRGDVEAAATNVQNNFDEDLEEVLDNVRHYWAAVRLAMNPAATLPPLGRITMTAWDVAEVFTGSELTKRQRESELAAYAKTMGHSLQQK